MPAYQYIHVMQRLSKTYPGGKTVLSDITLSFLPGAKIGVLGPNGAGKSTLLKIMAGIDREFIGEAWTAEGARVGYLAQEPKLDETLDVRGNVMLGLAAIKALLDEYNAISARFAEVTDDNEMTQLIEQQAALQEKIDAADAWDLDRTIDIAMDALGCPPGDASVARLSGGERRRVALARLLLEKPDLLLLDEPTNHLDAASVAWLQRFLTDYTGTVVMITHDRYFLDNVTGWILELDRGRGIPYEGNYTAYLSAKKKRLALEAKQEEERQKTLDRELEWMNATPEARRKKSKARIAAYHDMVAAGEHETVSHAQIVIPTPPRLGDTVIEAVGVTKGFGNKVLMRDLSFRLPPGGIVGIIGPNGAGKTTLFRLMTGQEKPDQGTFKVGDTVVLGYVDQSRDSLDDQKTVWEEISGGVDVLNLGKITKPSRAYVSAFNFRGPDQQKKISMLSGGERNRVHLAKMLKTGANVLLLDEPTNDLDTETLSALEEALESFPGCAVIISHDRMFLDRLATHILAYEGDGNVVWFEGNYQDYEADRKRRQGQDETAPDRFKYKKIG